MVELLIAFTICLFGGAVGLVVYGIGAIKDRVCFSKPRSIGLKYERVNDIAEWEKTIMKD